MFSNINLGGVLILLVIAIIILGIIFVPKMLRGENISVRIPHFTKQGKKDGGPQPNSLNVYSGKVAFEYVAEPMGMTQKCLSDNKEYYVHEYDPTTEKLKEWILPDNNEAERHYDPHEMANVVSMPCSKKYLEWTPNTFQKVAFGIMAVIIAIEIVALIILTG